MELSQEIALGLEQDVVSFSKCFMADGLGDVTFSRAGWSCNKDGVFFFDKSASGDIHDEGDRDFVIEGEVETFDGFLVSEGCPPESGGELFIIPSGHFILKEEGQKLSIGEFFFYGLAVPDLHRVQDSREAKLF